MTGYWISQAISAAAELGVADYLVDGPATAEELAKATGTEPSALYRLLRALSSVGVFRQGQPGRFEHSAMSELLRRDSPDSMCSLARIYGAELFRAWGDFGYSVRTGRPAFEHVLGVGPFEWFEQHPEAGRTFNEAMTGYTFTVANAAVAAHDFTPYRTVVDVGGSLGTLLVASLGQSGASRGILFDLPHVIDEARPHLAALGFADRTECAAGDFFDQVPSGGDAYLLSQILHDWSDEQCVTILRACRAAMAEDGTLLIVELVIPEDDEPFFGKWLDLHMMVCLTGKERTEAEFRALLAAAGFELHTSVPTAAGPSVLEAKPEPRQG